MPSRTSWITLFLLFQVILSWGVTVARVAGAALAVVVASTALMLISLILTAVQAQEMRKAQAGAVRRIMVRRLRGLVGHFNRTVPHEQIRANVMCIDSRADVLRVFAHTGLSVRETNLVWEKGQGLCGVAWREGRVQIAPAVTRREFDAQKAKNYSTPWNITEMQCEATKGLGTVASLPLYVSDGDDHIVGVLNFDSKVEPSASILAEILSSELYKALDLADLLTSVP